MKDTNSTPGTIRSAPSQDKLSRFRQKIRDYRRPTSHSQNELSVCLGLHPAVLSNKLNGTNSAYLTNSEICHIIKILAEWEALSYQSEVVELLGLANLKPSSFSPQEWQSFPLNRLEMDALPDNLTSKLPENSPAISTFSPGPLPVTPPIQLLSKRTDNLPAQTTPLIGRENQLNSIRQLLQRVNVRFLTLTGPGGIGKTRLAQGAALALVNHFQDGVFQIELASLTDPDLVPAVVARAFYLKEENSGPNQPSLVEVLSQFFQKKQLLLFLDNFEQVASATLVLKEWLARAPGLKVMTTSRILLRTYGEHEFKVPPLEVPNLAQMPLTGLEDLASNEAVALFLQRALLVNSTFRLNAQNAAAIAEICVLLEGVPLAIELAASRLKLLTPKALLDHLKGTYGYSPLRILTQGSKDEHARHETLRSTIDWSYEALEKPEKELFYRLAVFEGGFKVEAAEALYQKGSFILESLTSLIDHSLLRKVERPDQEERITYLETIREYALEKLVESGEEEACRAQHFNYFLEQAEKAEPALTGPNQQDMLNYLEQELPNLRTALRWAIGEAHGDKTPADQIDRLSLATELKPSFQEGALKLSCALGRFWLLKGHISEGRNYLEANLRDSHHLPARLRARAYNYLGSLAAFQGDYNPALFFYETSLTLWRELNDPAGQALVLNNLGNLAKEKNQLEKARELYEETLALNRLQGNKNGTAIALNNLGNLYFENFDFDRAGTFYEESLSLKKEAGNQAGIALAYNNMGNVALRKGNYDQASELYEECLRLYLLQGNKGGISRVYFNLGEVCLYRKEYSKAKPLLQQSLALWWEIDNRSELPRCFEALAAVASAELDFRRATRLYACSDFLRTTLEMPLPPTEVIAYNESLTYIQAKLDKATYHANWETGREMNLASAVLHALVQS